VLGKENSGWNENITNQAISMLPFEPGIVYRHPHQGEVFVTSR
jgi:hypothetical protein